MGRNYSRLRALRTATDPRHPRWPATFSLNTSPKAIRSFTHSPIHSLPLRRPVADAAHGFEEVGGGELGQLFAHVFDVHVDVVRVGVVFEYVAPEVLAHLEAGEHAAPVQQ